MAKRFSARETALLMLPVLFVGALGLWLSRRASTPRDERLVQLQFRLEKPTTLEAFYDIDAVFRIEPKDSEGKSVFLRKGEQYLEVKTAHGIETMRSLGNRPHNWTTDVWAVNGDNLRFAVRLKGVPAGTMSFGYDGIAQPPFAPPGATPVPLKALRVSGKWKIDRSRIKPIDLAALPRQPLVSLREVIIIKKEAGTGRAGMPGQITGKVVFELHSSAINEKSPFAVSFSNATGPNNATLNYLMQWGSGQTKDTPRRRVREWTLYGSPGTQTQARVSGLASADNRWPLGFEFEPFDFKTAKVGQKLKFKQFPVALPQKVRNLK